MEFFFNLTIHSIQQVWLTLQHNWMFLLASALIAPLLKLYLDAERVSAFLSRYRRAGVLAATAAAVTTPLCSCGTTAVVLGMMASTLPWAPIIAFMVSSPLTSPEELIYSAGLFGWPFAIAFFLSSIFLGLAGGWVGAIFESQGWLKNQTRFSEPAASTRQPEKTRVYSQDISNLMLPDPQPAAPCECSAPAAAPAKTTRPPVTLRRFAKEAYASGKRLLLMFLGFAFVGYFLNGLIPASWITALFGSGNAYSVPLAATLGLPFYINTEASLPLVRAMMESGMSQGAALAFLISGSGTSIGAIAGALTIARWRIVALVVGVLWAGAIVAGMTYNLVLAMSLF